MRVLDHRYIIWVWKSQFHFRSRVKFDKKVVDLSNPVFSWRQIMWNIAILHKVVLVEKVTLRCHLIRLVHFQLQLTYCKNWTTELTRMKLGIHIWFIWW